ncbi:MAG TPA: hypothetical protein DHV62_01820, partial [Elusimicrobia bacterium]|nr:hypothetical protein [Elusimicrobiota bacterium]
MNIRRIYKLSFFVFVYLLIFVNLSNAVSTSTTVPSGIWNSTSTWREGTIPTPADDVTINQGFTIYLDTFAPCNALSITLEKYAKIEFLGVVRSTLTVSSDITFGEGAKIEIISNNSNDYFTLAAGDLLLSNSGAKFTLTANATNSQFKLNVKNINIGSPNEFLIRLNSFNNQVDLTATGSGSGGKITVDANANFSVRITSGPSIVNLNIDDISIATEGTTELKNDVYSSTITLNLAGSLINNGILKIWATDPGGINKPDSPTVRRNCQVVGTTAYAYIRVRSGSSTSLLHSEFSGLGRAVIDEYGICVTDLDGTSASGKFEIFNCNIHNGYVGIYLKNSTRLNKWYNHGISSSVIHNNAFAGIWFENTTKSELYKCIISTNSTVLLNIGYGIYSLGSSMNSIIGSNIYGNKIKGIYLKNSDKNLIKDNLVYDQNQTSGEEGIYLYGSQKNVILNNECYGNPVHGIALEYGSNYNYLAKNYCYNNGNGGLRVRYNSDNNVFVTNVSSANSRTGFSSHSSIKNLALEEAYRNNALGDILIEGEANKGYKSQLWLKNCLLQSPTDFADTPEKEEFTHPESWVISQKHNRTNGLTRIWGNFIMPPTWLTSELKWNYSSSLYEETILSWISGQIPDLRYDDSGGRAISSITTSSTTKTELWLVSYDAERNRWLVQGSASGIQKNWLDPDNPNYTSDNREVTFRLTHQAGGPNPGEDYVFITVANSKDENVQKTVEFSDFSDPKYIGASFTNQTGSSFEIVGTSTNPTIIT